MVMSLILPLVVSYCSSIDSAVITSVSQKLAVKNQFGDTAMSTQCNTLIQYVLSYESNTLCLHAVFEINMKFSSITGDAGLNTNCSLYNCKSVPWQDIKINS